MNFEEIKQIVKKEGKVVIIDNNEAYIISKYGTQRPIEEVNEEVNEIIEEERQEPLNIEDLPF
jgi:predicted metallo-beta-lactamase superfamily hydrolase